MQLQSLLKTRTTPVKNPEFYQDVCDLFGERRAGHMSKWNYSTPQYAGDKARGAEAWVEAISEAKNGSPYYVFQKERDIINTFAPKSRDYFKGDARLVDLGPGSVDAVQHKVMPFIRGASATIREYTCVDVCATTLNMAEREVKKEFPFIRTSSLNKDFIHESFRYGTPLSPEVATMFGLTLCNMEIDPRVVDLPNYQLAACLKRLQSHFSGTEQYLFITQDTNQDPESLKAAYMALEEHFTSLLYRIRRDLTVAGDFDPDNFTMEVDYFPQTQACALCFVAEKSMIFSVEDEIFMLEEGQRFYFHNAFKFDAKTFLTAADKAGFEPVHCEQADENPCILHVLKSR